MKKLIALFMATFMVLSLCAVCAVAEEPVNVAPKATYEVHDFYQQQKTQPWGWSDDPADTVYGDETGKDLTDGKHAPTAGYGEAEWIGMSAKHPNAEERGQYIVFKLDKAYEIGTILITVSNLCSSGIAAPASITAYHSDNGTDYVGGVAGEYTAELVEGEVATYKIELNQTTQYIKFDYKNSEKNTWMFTDEIEIYTKAATSEPTTTTTTTTTIDLLGNFGEPTITPGGDGNLTYTLENGVLTVAGDQGWPSIDLPFTEALNVDIANTRVILEATIENGDGSIRFLGADDSATNDDIYLHQFAEGVTLGTSGDATGPATINLDIAFSDLAFCDYSAETDYAGKIAFTEDTVNISKFQVWACGGATVKVTKLQLVVTTEGGDKPSIPATGDNGIVALVVLAAVSLFGSAVVIKSRH